jgi:hypothetical protein
MKKPHFHIILKDLERCDPMMISDRCCHKHYLHEIIVRKISMEIKDRVMEIKSEMCDLRNEKMKNCS